MNFHFEVYSEVVIYFEDLVKKTTDDMKKLKRDYSTLESLQH